MPNVSANIDTFLRSADNAAARSNLGVPSFAQLTRPRTYYVTTTGNNATAEPGNPAKPYATATAAYDALIASGFASKIKLGVGSFTLSTGGTNLLSGLVAIEGEGAGDASSFATSLTIDTRPSGISTNANGANGGSVRFWLEVNNLVLSIDTRGQSVTCTEEEATYNAGNGGQVEIRGTARILSVLTSGGGNEASSAGTVSPGNGGDIDIKSMSPFATATIDSNGGTGYPTGVGAIGAISIDGTDIRSLSFMTTGGSLTVGRCSYQSGTLSITSDAGGNAAY